VVDVDAILQDEQERRRETLIAAACRLVGSDEGVRSVRVLSPSRPAYDELLCYQKLAHDQHVRLSLDGNCVVTVRPEPETEG